MFELLANERNSPANICSGLQTHELTKLRVKNIFSIIGYLSRVVSTYRALIQGHQICAEHNTEMERRDLLNQTIKTNEEKKQLILRIQILEDQYDCKKHLSNRTCNFDQ
ncbi:Hypothetical_protein [Hexamita inflata]|uniref:Hypothetical_protein n=1 Tax=Hexamita inflata TaxID=28002 RepID=A0ABP1HIR2_9EUKA